MRLEAVLGQDEAGDGIFDVILAKAEVKGVIF